MFEKKITKIIISEIFLARNFAYHYPYPYTGHADFCVSVFVETLTCPVYFNLYLRKIPNYILSVLQVKKKLEIIYLKLQTNFSNNFYKLFTNYFGGIPGIR